MTILSQKYIGNIKICEKCGCLFAFNAQDIYEGKFVYCPICHEQLETHIYESTWRFINEVSKEEKDNAQKTINSNFNFSSNSDNS